METNLSFNVIRVLPVSNVAVWDVLGNFGTEHRWTKSLAHCERDTVDVAIGTVRTCTLPKPLMGRTKVREALVEYVPLSGLTYELEGSAGPFASARSRWSTREREDGATDLAVEGTFTPHGWFSRYLLWPMAKPMITRLTKQVMAELASYLEAGGAAARV